MKKILQRKRNEWVPVMYSCTNCNKTFTTLRYVTKHELSCKDINTINKSSDIKFNLLIQHIIKNAENYYRRGFDGKLYKTLKEAKVANNILDEE